MTKANMSGSVLLLLGQAHLFSFFVRDALPLCAVPLAGLRIWELLVLLLAQCREISSKTACFKKRAPAFVPNVQCSLNCFVLELHVSNRSRRTQAASF